MVDLKSVLFWFVGTVCIFFGSLIAGAVDPTALGSTSYSVIAAYVIAFVLILIGGMLWISTAILQVEEG